MHQEYFCYWKCIFLTWSFEASKNGTVFKKGLQFEQQLCLLFKVVVFLAISLS